MGTLKVNGHIEGNYIKANWLYTSAATAVTNVSKIACIGSDNFIYYITPANMSVGNATTCNGTALEWSGSIAWADTGWIAAWNSDGTKIKALNKNSFASASHSHSYVPLSGATMSGALWLRASSGEIDLGVGHASGKWLYLYGNSTSGARGLYDSNKGSVISVTDSTATFYGNLSGTADSATNADKVDGYHASSFAFQGSHNNLTASGNEFTFASSGFSGSMYVNYRTAGGSNGNITEYIFQNGAGSNAAIKCSGGYMSGGLAIVNHTQNNNYDALLFVSHHSTNEWGIVIDKNGSYDWGLYINCGQGNYGLQLNGGLTLFNGIGYGSSFPSNPAVGRIFFKT